MNLHCYICVIEDEPVQYEPVTMAFGTLVCGRHVDLIDTSAIVEWDE